MTLEPNFVAIDAKTKELRTVSDLGDLETALEYEFIRELRYRPALTLEGLVKWSTATDPDPGSPGTDDAIGLIASKDLVFLDLDFGVRYMFIGDPEGNNTVELTLAATYPVNHAIDVEAEVVQTLEIGASDENITEGTIGLAWHVNENLKLERGVLIRDNGLWQMVSALGWSFAGED
ncbi:MAG: hypothetical protein ACYC9Y_00475 [Candidatus Methylomirabilia bacterium]